MWNRLVLGTGLLVAVVIFLAGPGGTSVLHAEDPLTVEVTLENDAFSPAEAKVPAGKPFVLKVTNKGTAAAEIEAKEAKIEKVAAGNSVIIVRVRPLQPGRYLFVNEYKEDSVKGYLVAE